MTAVPIHITVDVGGKLGTLTTVVENDGLSLLGVESIARGISVFIVERLEEHLVEELGK